MSRELEALERLIEYRRIDVESVERDDGTSYENDISIIEKALQRLEAIDNANPSEALKYLENMIDTFLVENKNKIEFNKVNNYDCELLEERRKDLESYKQALIKAQEQGKVLEILFKKQVDLGWLWYCIHECVNSLNEYNKKMPIEKFKLTQEEFNLLKKVEEDI